MRLRQSSFAVALIVAAFAVDGAYAQSRVTIYGQVSKFEIDKPGSFVPVGRSSVSVGQADDPTKFVGMVSPSKEDGCWEIPNIDATLRLSVSVKWIGPAPEYLETGPIVDQAAGFGSACPKARANMLFHPDRYVREVVARAWAIARPIHAQALASNCGSMGVVDRSKCFQTGAGRILIESNAAALNEARVLWEKAFAVVRKTDDVLRRARFEIDLGTVCRASQLFESLGIESFSGPIETYSGEASVQWLESAYACVVTERSQMSESDRALRLKDLHSLANRLLAARTKEEKRAIARLLQTWLLSFGVAAKDNSAVEVARAIRADQRLQGGWNQFREQFRSKISAIDDPTTEAGLAKTIDFAFSSL